LHRAGANRAIRARLPSCARAGSAAAPLIDGSVVVVVPVVDIVEALHAGFSEVKLFR